MDKSKILDRLVKEFTEKNITEAIQQKVYDSLGFSVGSRGLTQLFGSYEAGIEEVVKLLGVDTTDQEWEQDIKDWQQDMNDEADI